MSNAQFRAARRSEDDGRSLRAMSEAGKSLTPMTVKLDRPMASIKARAADPGPPFEEPRSGSTRREGPHDTGGCLQELAERTGV